MCSLRDLPPGDGLPFLCLSPASLQLYAPHVRKRPRATAPEESQGGLGGQEVVGWQYGGCFWQKAGLRAAASGKQATGAVYRRGAYTDLDLAAYLVLPEGSRELL